MNRHHASFVDLGSNSARLVVYEYEPGAGLQLIDEIREVIRLGEGVIQTGRLSAEGIDRAVVALRTFGDYVEAVGLPAVRVMATSAVRDAANSEELLERVRALGLEIEVLPGDVEAAQGVLAVGNTSRFADAWVADLGGGSVQLSLMRDRRYRGGTAHPFGAISARERFLADDPPTPGQVRALEKAVDAELDADLARIRSDGIPLIAMGGTVRNLAAAVQRRTAYPWRMMHAYFLRTDDLEELTEHLLGRRAAARARVPGISGYRSDIILAGALVYRQIARRAQLEGITISGFGMREGALFQEVLDPPHLVADVRRFSVENLLWQYPQPGDHTGRVVHLSLRLFDELASVHELGHAERELLRYAAMLHDIGKAIHYRDHDKHGEYLLGGAPLPGFAHREQILLSLMVRHHRGGRIARVPYRGVLSDRDRQILIRLSTCLRLAEYLDRSRTGRVQDVRATVQEQQVSLQLVSDGEPWLEFWETQKQAPLFERAFQRRLHLEFRAV